MSTRRILRLTHPHSLTVLRSLTVLHSLTVLRSFQFGVELRNVRIPRFLKIKLDPEHFLRKVSIRLCAAVRWIEHGNWLTIRRSL